MKKHNEQLRKDTYRHSKDNKECSKRNWKKYTEIQELKIQSDEETDNIRKWSSDIDS
jgi:hypothetical protein